MRRPVRALVGLVAVLALLGIAGCGGDPYPEPSQAQVDAEEARTVAQMRSFAQLAESAQELFHKRYGRYTADYREMEAVEPRLIDSQWRPADYRKPKADDYHGTEPWVEAPLEGKTYRLNLYLYPEAPDYSNAQLLFQVVRTVEGENLYPCEADRPRHGCRQLEGKLRWIPLNGA